MKKTILIILFVLTIVCITACDKSKDNKDNTATSTPEPTHTVVTDEKAHYLIFMIEDTVAAKMLVTETDTYDELKNYFPTIPEKEDYTSYWEEKEVYSSDQKEIYINAYYVKK